MLASGVVDFALTYNVAAETQAVKSGAALERAYAFRVRRAFFERSPLACPGSNT